MTDGKNSVAFRLITKKVKNMKYKQLEKTGLNVETVNLTPLDFFYSIPYIRELMGLKLVDNINTCLLMAKFEILFSQNPDYFCKYMNPCKWASDLGELTWSEELGMSKAVLGSTFKKIVTQYRTKKEYLSAEDKFKGKYYCSYIDTLDDIKTYYFRNNELVKQSLIQLYRLGN